MKNRYLITGATGFIGSNIVRELIRRKQHVSIITRSRKLNWRLKDVGKDIEVYCANILDKSLEKAVVKAKSDFIFHLASYGIPPHENDISQMIDVNLKGTINLINAAKKTKFKLFINTGSCFEYGNKTKKIKEADFLEPTNDYAVIKSAITLYCQKEAIREKLPMITLRLFTPFGYFEEGYRLIPSVILSAVNNKPIKVSTPKSVRDFTFIDDVVNAYIKTTKKDLPNGSIFNIGSGKQQNIGEVIETIIRLSKSKSEVQWGAVQKQARYLEPTMLEADLSHTKKILGWKPKNSLESGIIKTVDWFKENNDLYRSS